MFSTLYCVARGYALIAGRTQLSEEDVRATEKIALSSMPEDRRRILAALRLKALLSSTEVMETVGGCSRPTALALMDELDSLKVVEKIQVNGSFCIKMI